MGLLMGKTPVAFAQSIVKGVVQAADNSETLPGVNITVKGKGIKAISDKDGNYSIKVFSPNDILQFSSVGYVAQEQSVQGKSILNVKLVSSRNSLDELVVVGYGTQRRGDITGAVASVNISDLAKAPVGSFEEALAGRVAGVQVSASDGQPGAPLNVVIRGVSSLTQDTSPLYVIDGFPVDDYENNLINPADIESIEVLKDASATAIYGSRGGNGVVLITTKKGVVGAPKINYQFFHGFQNDIKRQKMMSPYEFVKYTLEIRPSSSDLYLKNRTLESYKDTKGIDWQDVALRTGQTSSHNISLSGGNDKTTYSISGSLFNQRGILLNSGYKRYQGRAKIDQVINSNLKAGINLNLSSTEKYGLIPNMTEDNSSSTVNLMFSVWGYRPVSGGDDAMDEEMVEDPVDEETSSASETRFNPILSLKNEYNPSFNNSFFGNAYLEYKFLENFTLRVTGGVTRGWMRKDVFYNTLTRYGSPNTIQGRTTGMNGSIYNTETLNLLNENTLTYRKRFNKIHNLTALAGFTTQKYNRFYYGFSAIQVPNASLGLSGLDEGLPNLIASVQSLNGLGSILGRVNYDYKSRYFLTLSFRADGSSKFANGNKWAYFPSGSFAWRLKNEPFFKNPFFDFVSDAKLRLGYGVTGNNRVSDFAYLNTLAVSGFGYGFNNGAMPSAYPSVLGNPDIKWESSVMSNLGLDLAFFKGKIEFTADVYQKNTKDLLFNATLNPSTGYTKGFKNIGEISNRGLELTLNTINLSTKNFSWQSNFNVTFNRNKVISLNEDQEALTSAVAWSSQYNTSTPYIAVPGNAVALFYGFVFDGIYQYADFNELSPGNYSLKGGIPTNGNVTVQPGDIKYKDINGDGLVNLKDRTIIGDPNPSAIGGFSNNFRYKGFDLNVFFQWSYGNDVLNANRIEFEGGSGRSNLNQFAVLENRWTPENQSNYYFRTLGRGPNVYSSRIVEDASYLRLKTVSLGYNLPAQFINKIKLKQLRIYTSAQNLVTWSNYSGLDPDVSVRQSALTPGFDWSAYPTARTITFGLNANF